MSLLCVIGKKLIPKGLPMNDDEAWRMVEEHAEKIKAKRSEFDTQASSVGHVRGVMPTPPPKAPQLPAPKSKKGEKESSPKKKQTASKEVQVPSERGNKRVEVSAPIKKPASKTAKPTKSDNALAQLAAVDGVEVVTINFPADASVRGKDT